MATNYLGQEINLMRPLPNPSLDDRRAQVLGGAAQPFDMNAMLAAFAQMQQQQQQGQLGQQQNFFDNTSALGKTAAANSRPGGLTSGAQWSSMFGENAASAMSPQARLASQGPSAMNQWASFGNTPGALQMQEMNRQVGNARFDSADKGYYDPVAAAVGASPAPFQLSPDTLAMAGLQPNAPTLQSPERIPARAAQPIPMGPPQSMMNQQNDPNAPKKRKGSSFGMQASGSPRPGFGF